MTMIDPRSRYFRSAVQTQLEVRSAVGSIRGVKRWNDTMACTKVYCSIRARRGVTFVNPWEGDKNKLRGGAHSHHAGRQRTVHNALCDQ